MKKIIAPTDETGIKILDDASKEVIDLSICRGRCKLPYDQVLVLRLARKAINKALKSTGN